MFYLGFSPERKTMPFFATVVLIGVMLIPIPAYAQDSLAGKYTGSITRQQGSKGLTLVIDSAQGGVVKGTATRTEKNCKGDYPVEGKVEANKLKLSALKKGGLAGDCSVNWDLTIEGNKLVGTTGSGHQIELSK